MGYLRRKSNYSKRISLFDLIHIMSMINPIAIDAGTLKIHNGCYLKKEFTQFIYIDP